MATSTSRSSAHSNLDNFCLVISTEPPQDHDNSLPFEEQETDSNFENAPHSLDFGDLSDLDVAIEIKSDICEWSTTLPRPICQSMRQLLG